ncbi:MAG TPA: alpha/beta fold hydrolase, partial [Candidatus Saccharimonadales bacterium]|nr:alpha/beta fold hydrolase [Candidatus Saccharimonadales bacterium]
MNQVKIQGSQVHYWVFNPKRQQTIVMIHGFRGTHHGLQNIIDRLDDYKIIIPDLPGFGASTPF